MHKHCMRRSALGVALAISLAISLACIGCDGETGQQPAPGPQPPAPPPPPPTWETSTIERQWTYTGLGESFEMVAVDGGEALITAGRRVARLDAGSMGEQEPTWWLTWPEDLTTMQALEMRFPSAAVAFDSNLDGEEEALILEGANVYLVSSSTGEILREHRALTRAFNPFSLELIGDGDVPDYAVAGGDLVVFSGETGEMRWQANFDDWAIYAKRARIDENGTGVVVALEVSEIDLGGEVTVPPRPSIFGFADDGELLFDFVPSGMVWSVAAGDLDGDGVDEVFAGTDLGYVHAISVDGLELWRTDVGGATLGNTIVREILVEDVTGDGRGEVLVSLTLPDVAYSVVLALDADGNELWRKQVPREYARLRLFTLENGQRVLMHLTRDYWLLQLGSVVAVDPANGEVYWQHPTGSFSAELVRIGGVESIAVGGADSRVRLVDPLTGEQRQSFTSGGYIEALAVVDLDGDDIDEIVTGDFGGRLATWDASGELLWETFLPHTAIQDVAAGELRPGEGKRVVAAGVGGPVGQRSWLQIHDETGRMLRTAGSNKMFWEVELADLTGDGTLEIIVAASTGIDGPCYLIFMDSEARFQQEVLVPACSMLSLSVRHGEEDRPAEIGVLGIRAMGPSWTGIVEADGAHRFMKQLLDYYAGWMDFVEDDLVVAGARGGTLFAVDVAARLSGVDGTEVWRYVAPAVPDRHSEANHGLVVPGLGVDGGAALAVSTNTKRVRLLDAGTGEKIWTTQLEQDGLPERDWRGAGPLAFVPASESAPAWIAAIGGSTSNHPGHAHALDLDGELIASIYNEGSGKRVLPLRTAPDRLGVAASAGLGLHLLEGAPAEP